MAESLRHRRVPAQPPRPVDPFRLQVLAENLLASARTAGSPDICDDPTPSLASLLDKFFNEEAISGDQRMDRALHMLDLLEQGQTDACNFGTIIDAVNAALAHTPMTVAAPLLERVSVARDATRARPVREVLMTRCPTRSVLCGNCYPAKREHHRILESALDKRPRVTLQSVMVISFSDSEPEPDNVHSRAAARPPREDVLECAATLSSPSHGSRNDLDLLDRCDRDIVSDMVELAEAGVRVSWPARVNVDVARAWLQRSAASACSTSPSPSLPPARLPALP